MARSFMPTPQPGLACESGPEDVEPELKSPLTPPRVTSASAVLGSGNVCGYTTDTSGPTLLLYAAGGGTSGTAGAGPDGTCGGPRVPTVGALFYYNPNKTDYKLES